MDRYITVDKNNRVIGIRYGSEIIKGEIRSDTGELGQILQPNGTFLTLESEPMKPESNPVIDRLDLLIQMQLEREGIV